MKVRFWFIFRSFLFVFIHIALVEIFFIDLKDILVLFLFFFATQQHGYAKQKKYDLSLKEFEKAIELNPRDHVAYNNIGIIYKLRGKK